ncbi:hypothetical protein GGR88_001596 [Sphingomonas jejuensis]|uniref:JmjC domain-containing protein n=1 Tax=Sphingomonas jejuensis TaxID=904715 RepID=A0ABX0XL78_9SPHN|nr:cupin-like domain-containing protein [Sphingomonas jejuensis]NJC34122.1 hypothetical protein [Sphingomonas jejuensis]
MTQEVPVVEADALRSDAAFREQVMVPGRPVVLAGAAREWPLLKGGQAGVLDALRTHDAGNVAELFVGKPAIAGRFHYGDGPQGFNFDREAVPFAEALERISATAGQAGADSLYMGSLPAERYLPGIETLTALPFLPAGVRPRIWIGHASQVACHYDVLDNVACVAAGRRRFTLYPPEAIRDLYVGPIDHTMAGQPVSLAADSAPGDERYPRFERVRDRAMVVELGPGDAIYIPKLWWHKVEALEPLNVLANFWWDGFAAGPDQPYAAMLLAMIAIAERPPAERMAWRAWFDHYAFRPNGHPLAFLPESERGVLGPLADGNYQRLRVSIMRMLRGA